MKYIVLFFALCFFVFSSCQSGDPEQLNEAHSEVADNDSATVVSSEFLVNVTELTDEQYPDNPDIGFRSKNYGKPSHNQVSIKRLENGNFSFTFLPGNELSDSIVLGEVDVTAYMPSTPEWVKEDDYLTYIGVINQEWNRQQVRYDNGKGLWSVMGEGYDSKNLTRIDLARNCLNSGLWEIIAFEDNGKGGTTPYYHGWFLFPMDLYESLFNEVSGLDWADYQAGMVDWEEPVRKTINFDYLRKVKKEIAVEVTSLNGQYYPLTGAREKKEKNILKPRKHEKIQDFLTDETLYSTFSPPGFYNTDDPRQTFLSLLADFKGAKVREVENVSAEYDSTLLEIELSFSNLEGTKNTNVFFGGIDTKLIPTLSLEQNNSGYKMPMGIANHAFYETYERMLNNPVSANPYYAVVTDNDGLWFDSHALGIDGPLIFWDSQNEKMLHVLIMSFERHSFVGHFTIQF